MIIKKIAPPKKSNDPKSGIPILINYIANPTSETKLEKCVYFNARNFHVKPSNVNNNLFYSHQMLGMACECPRSKYPFAHYVFSWRESENPSIEQIEEAIDIFCEFNGYEKCQMLYGLHDDTKNTHLHLLVNRVKEEIDENLEYKYSCVHKFQDLMLCQKAVAKINAIQGWDTNNVNFKYSYDATSDSITERPENKRGQGKKLPTDIVDKEHSTGIKSAMRIAREQITDIILKATSWDNLHQELLSNGFAYKSRGQGAVIKQRVNGNDIYVKASSIHKDFTIKKLEVKFGKKFESAGIPKEGVFLKNKEENPTEETKKLFEDSFDSYKSDRQKYVYNKKIILDELKIEYETKITKIKDDRKKEMDSLFASSWTGRGKELNEKRSEISARYKKLLEDVQNEYKRKRDDIKKQFKTTKNLHNIKNYVTGSPLFSCSGKIWQESYVTPKPCIFFDFKYKKIGHDIIYYNKLFPDVISFVDTGKRIVFYSDSEAEIKTGLSLAKKKWKTVFYSGNQTYAEMCERIGAKQNITVLRRKIFDEDILKPEAQRQRKKIFIWEEEADIDYEQTKPLISGFISSGRFVKPYPVPMFGFKSRKDGIFILYFMGNRNDSPSFKDAGSRIYIFGSSEDEILAGLKLAQFKWGSFSLFGSLDFQKQAASIAIKNGLNFVLDDSLAETDFSRWVKNEFPSYFLTPSPQKPKIDPSRLSSDPPVRGYFPHKKTKDDTLLPSIFRPLKDKIVPRPGFRISITSRLSSLIASDPPVASSQNPSPPPQETKDNPLRPSSDPPIRKKLTRIYSSSSDPPDAKNLVPSPPTAALSLYISQNKEDVSEDNAKIPLNSKTSPLTPPDSRPYSSDVKKPVSSPPPPPPPSAPPAPQGKTEPQIEKKAVSLAESVPSPPISGLAQKKVDADPGPAPPSVPPKPATQLPVEPPEKASSPPPPPTPSPPPPPPPSSPSPQLPLPSKTPKQVFPVLVLSCLGRVFPCDADNLDGLVSEYIKDGKELAFYSKNTGSLALVDRGSDLLLFSQDKAALRDSYNYIIKKCNNYSYQVDPKYSDSPFMGALSDSVGLWVKSNNNLSLRNLFFSTYVSLKKKVEDADSLKPILRLYGDNTKIVVPHFLWDYLDGPYFSESSSKGYFFPKSSYDDVSPPAVLALGANFIDLYPHDSRKLDSYSLVDTFLITSSYRWPGKGLLIEGDPCWLDVAGSVAKELAGKGLHVNFSSLPVAGGSSPKTVPPSLPSHPSPPSSKRGRRPK